MPKTTMRITVEEMNQVKCLRQFSGQKMASPLKSFLCILVKDLTLCKKELSNQQIPRVEPRKLGSRDLIKRMY